MEFRPIDDADLDDLLVLNQSFVPHVGPTDRERLGWLVEHACWARTTPARDAFLIALPPGTDYWSPNYAWIQARWRDFAYVDRIAVSTSLQGTGVGRALYEALFADMAAAGVGRITCEVNTRIAFHERLGFRRAGVRGDAKGTVAMMSRPLP